MRNIDNFKLTKTEIKKVERAANKISGRTDTFVVMWSRDIYCQPDCDGFIKVKCEIGYNGKKADLDVELAACVRDSRKSYVCSDVKGYTLTVTDLKICRKCLDKYLPGVVAPDAEYHMVYLKKTAGGVIYTRSINGHRIELGYRIISSKRTASFVVNIKTHIGSYDVCCEAVEAVEDRHIRDILYDDDAVLYDRALLERNQIIMTLEHFASTWILSDTVIGNYYYTDGKYIFGLVNEYEEISVDLSIDYTLSLETLEIINHGSIIYAGEMVKTGFMAGQRCKLLAQQYMDDIGVPYDYCSIERVDRNSADILCSKGYEYRATVTIRFNANTLLTDISITGLLVSNTLIDNHGIKSWNWKSVDNSWSEMIECKRTILQIIYGVVVVTESLLNRLSDPSLLLRDIGYRIVKHSKHMGYVKKYGAFFEPYNGIYGEGFVEHHPSSDSTRFHVITYWIKK